MNPLRLSTCGLARCLTLTLTLTLTLGKCRCLLRLQMVGEEAQACSPVRGLLGKQTESTLSIPVMSVVPAVSWVGPGLGVRLLAVLSCRFTLYMWALQLSLSFLLSVERNTCSVCRSAGWWASGTHPPRAHETSYQWVTCCRGEGIFLIRDLIMATLWTSQ